jgi:hypothetical protein
MLKNMEHRYFIAPNPEVNGNFSGRFDLGQVEPGEYAFFVVGAVVKGMDCPGKVYPGYNPAGYKIQVK